MNDLPDETGGAADGPASARSRWRHVVPDPDDTSPDARFRRQLLAVAREVLLARGADHDMLPPESALPESAVPEPAAPEHAAPGPAAPRPDGSYFDVRGGTPYALDAAARAMDSVIRGAGGPLRSTPLDLVLLAVARSPDGLTSDRLARTVDLPPATRSAAVSRLVEGGLLERRRGTADRRRRVLTATAAGLRVAERVAAVWRQADERLLYGLSSGERAELGRLLRRATAALGVVPSGRASILETS